MKHNPTRLSFGLCSPIASLSKIPHFEVPELPSDLQRITHYVQYSWTGAIVEPFAQKKVHAIAGTFTVPDPHPPTSADSMQGPWGGSAWVGINTVFQSKKSIFQHGVNWCP